MSTDEEQKKCVAHTEEELLNFKKELGLALKERIALNDLLKDAWVPDPPDEVEEYLAVKRLCQQYFKKLDRLNERIGYMTDILIN